MVLKPERIFEYQADQGSGRKKQYYQARMKDLDYGACNT